MILFFLDYFQKFLIWVREQNYNCDEGNFLEVLMRWVVVDLSSHVIMVH